MRLRIQPSLLYLCLALILGACGGDDNNNGMEPQPQPEPEPETQTYEVILKGEQEVPMVDSEQEAMAVITINETDMLVTAEIDLSAVSEVSGVHIHAGEAGTNGPVAFPFADEDEDGTWEIDGQQVSTEQHEALVAGNWYVNVHTTEFPDGELRGQILTDTQSVHVFTLSGEQEVPSVQTDAYGQGYLFYDSMDGAVSVNAWAWNIEPSAAHIHNAEAGLNGDVIVALEAGDTEGMWQTPDDAMLTSGEASELGMANLYVNVHTEANPGGEIRGQILPENHALVLFDLAPGQEVPRIDSDASGHGYATLNTDSGWLRLNAWAMDMTVSAAHIHQAEIGVNGGVAIALEENMNSAGLWQTPASTTIDADTQAQLMTGGHYVNMHSEDFPDGEIRGQIVASPWEVVAFSLSGDQEVPSITTEANGDGYALVNTESGDLSLRVNTRNLDTASAAHIHAGTAGMNGDVVVGLEQDSSDMSVWQAPAETSLDEATLMAFLDAGHYVNVHTPGNPAGEIRGQIVGSNTVMFPLSLSGDNSVPVVGTTATGEGAFTLNTHTGSLRGAFITENIVSTAAHIHEGMAGATGDVVVGLEMTLEGYQVPAETMLNADQMNTMLNAGYYVNVHSEAYPAGEIRAQVMQ